MECDNDCNYGSDRKYDKMMPCHNQYVNCNSVYNTRNHNNDDNSGRDVRMMILKITIVI